MAELPHPWNAYARLQAEVAQSRSIINQTWGTEAGLDRILASASDTAPPTDEEISRAVASGERRERHRAGLRMLYLDQAESAGDVPDAMVATKQELSFLSSQVAPEDWALLCQVAVGHEYEVIAVQRNATQNSLRVHVLRLRRELAKRIAA